MMSIINESLYPEYHACPVKFQWTISPGLILNKYHVSLLDKDKVHKKNKKNRLSE